MGAADNLVRERPDSHVLVDLDKAAECLLARMFVDFEGLLDNHAAFHLTFDEVDFGIRTTLEGRTPK